MRILSTLLFYVPRVAFRRAAVGRLATVLPPDVATQVWRKAQALHTELQARRPRHSLGVNFILRYMEWDCAVYGAVQEYGLPEKQAASLIEEINWDVFSPAIATGFTASRLRSAKLQTRVRWLLNVMFRVLFTFPFIRRSVPSPDGVAFDVVACPLAAYFKEQGVPELTRFAACNLDYRMARDWGVSLDRSQTIAEGASLCDFRFKITPLTDGKTNAQTNASSDRPATDKPAA